MIDHLSSYTLDFEASRAFYDAALSTLGARRVVDMTFDQDPDLPGRRACGYGPAERACFWVIEVKEAATPRHVAFAAADRDAVARFHAAALAAGGRDHGAPGPRPIYHEHYFGAFVLDPDGNNVEAVCHDPDAA